MIPLHVKSDAEPLKLLCLGAHSDDIEIGAGGTLLSLIGSDRKLDIVWCVASATGPRKAEAENSAAAFLQGVERSRIITADFQDGYFPYVGDRLKAWLDEVKREFSPDIVFTHRRDDAHQDHRELCQLTWNLFRDHIVLEYEIPKWDGDLGQPNTYVPLTTGALEHKMNLLQEHFGTQRSKDWFDRETFKGLARLRGMECRAPDGYAEAFFARKLLINPV